ncbi:glycosyltransferase family 1 protein [Williamsia sp. CHRR-6]|uniref:glycosyltransferase family 1 protein n=1 Tax=Williamsia sp. CHRR-6 TaxID=2835871 RepID=UPI001BD9821F|nr:glycosyltransferase family 1 protein [Williamsia sp. CHRR-6]MBT0565930.1 glycosyltransferase [Williamsia sp. CHRR-6]
MTELRSTTVVYVAPAAGRSGVGDYADDVVEAIRPHVAGVREYRITSDGSETVRTVMADVRAIRQLVTDASNSGPVVVHFEQSAGSLAAFWGSFLPRHVPVTATVHDAPQPVWWPWRTRLLMRYRLLHHLMHYPFRVVTNFLQRKSTDGRIVFALTGIGAQNLGARHPGTDARATRIHIPKRRELIDITERPVAVGMFGHVYKGKGFDLLGGLRERLPAHIGIVAAGRGTEQLDPVNGVTVLGEVNDEDEDKFFESIRLLVVPYSKNNRYGKAWIASSAVSRSFAYRTPIVCILDGALGEVVAEGGAVGVEGGLDALARRIAQVVEDTETLRGLGAAVDDLRTARTTERCVAPLLDAWAELAAR